MIARESERAGVDPYEATSGLQLALSSAAALANRLLTDSEPVFEHHHIDFNRPGRRASNDHARRELSGDGAAADQSP